MTRAGLFLAMAFATTGISYPALTPLPIKLLWNASASAPIGFYTIDFNGPFDVTDLVAVDAPEPLATFMAERGYLPKGVPLLKRILGVSGQTVCRSNELERFVLQAMVLGVIMPQDLATRYDADAPMSRATFNRVSSYRRRS